VFCYHNNAYTSVRPSSFSILWFLREKRGPQGRDNRETRYRNASHGGHDDRRQSSRDDSYRSEHRHKDDRYPDAQSSVSERRNDTDFFRDRTRDDQHRNGDKSRGKDWHTEDTDHFPKHKSEEALDKVKETKRYDADVDDRSRGSDKKERHWGSDEEVEELAEKIVLETKEPCWSNQSAVSYPARSTYSTQVHQNYGRAAKDGNKSSEFSHLPFISIFQFFVGLHKILFYPYWTPYLSV